MSITPSGIYAIDEIAGGFVKGSSILLAGAPGTGKTVLSAKFLIDGIRLGEPGVYVTFTEPKAFFIENLSKHLGVDLKKFEGEGKLKILDVTALGGGGASALLDAILDSVESLGARRLVIDSFSGLTNAVKDPLEVREIIHTIIGRIVRGMGCTTIIPWRGQASKVESTME